jgi:hypothetical protein
MSIFVRVAFSGGVTINIIKPLLVYTIMTTYPVYCNNLTYSMTLYPMKGLGNSLMSFFLQISHQRPGNRYESIEGNNEGICRIKFSLGFFHEP